jgi:hypothetical protein
MTADSTYGGFPTPVVNQTGFINFPPLTFQYGVPFNFVVQLGTFTEAGPDSGSATADFYDTAVLTGLRVFTANGDEVAHPSFAAVSGTEYSTEGVVPEPTSLTLATTGILLLLLKAPKLRSRDARQAR